MRWERPINPVRAVVFVAACALTGFLGGVGLAALLSTVLAKRLERIPSLD